jgi:hypothetical protein
MHEGHLETLPRAGDLDHPDGVAAPLGARQLAISAVTLKVAPDPGPIDYADNRTNGKGKWIFSSQLQGASVARAKVARSKASGVDCRSALSPAKRVR